MANVTISWNNPDDGSGNVNQNIDEIHVFRLNGDQTAAYPLTNGIVDADQATSFVNAYNTEAGNMTPLNSTDTNSYNYSSIGAVNFQDTSVSAGAYTYGVFSHNVAGYGPGDVASVTVS